MEVFWKDMVCYSGGTALHLPTVASLGPECWDRLGPANVGVAGFDLAISVLPYTRKK